MSDPSIIHMPPNETPVVQPSEDKDSWVTAAKHLNYFVGAVALLEKLGNGLGTLAFTWATVVVLGGLSTDLGVDLWYATAYVFLEALRVFSRESRTDDELLFKTTGSIRVKRMKLFSRGIQYYLTVSIVIVCIYGTLRVTLPHYTFSPLLINHRFQYYIILLLSVVSLACVAQAPILSEYVKNHEWLQTVSVLVAVLALGSAMLWSGAPLREVLLITLPLLVGCFQSVFKEVWGYLGTPCLALVQPKYNKLVSTLVALILPAWIVIAVLLQFRTMGILLLLGTLLLGNIQIPVAVARIVISVARLSSGKHNNDNDSLHHPGDDPANQHLGPALTIFYSMVLAQGVLYCAACVLESLFSSHIRRSLAKTCNLTYKEGHESIDLYYEHAYKSIDLYYEHAYNKRKQEGVLAQVEDMSLPTFAFKSLDSNYNDDNKLAAVQILHSLLQLNGGTSSSKKKLISEITASTKVVASLINMLGRTPASDDQKGVEFSIRWFTVKVIASLAGDLRIVGIPGTMQMISSLLDVSAKSKEKQGISNQEKQGISNHKLEKNEANINGNQQGDHPTSTVVEIQELSKQVEGGEKRGWSYIKLKFLKCIKNWLYSQEEGKGPSKDIDLFPILGMQILGMLAKDIDNSIEISKATTLIQKIMGFIINTTDPINNVMTSSLELIAKLANTEGEMGKTIRQKILDKPFFLSKLVEILVDTNSHTIEWKLTMVIMAKIILENETSKADVERFHAIIPKLMHAFLRLDESTSTNYDHLLRTLAGEALSKLVAESAEKPNICMFILQEKGYDLIGDLKVMLWQDKYTFVATSLLSNLCLHSQDMLHHSTPRQQLSSILQVVLEKILNSEGKQLQVLIITALQLHKLFPKKFAYELESRTNKEKFVQKLVDALNEKMSDECPSMRRVIVDITISIMESCPDYAPIFKSKRLNEALSKVQRIIVEVEKYRTFSGDARVVVFDSGLPPQDLVTKAKQLLGSEIPNQEANVHDSSLVDIVHVN